MEHCTALVNVDKIFCRSMGWWLENWNTPTQFPEPFIESTVAYHNLTYVHQALQAHKR